MLGAAGPGQLPSQYRRRGSVVLLQTTVPAYRRGLIDALERRLGGALVIVAGSEYFDPSIGLEVSHPHLKVVSNRFLLGRRLLWQAGAFKAAVAAGTLIV